MPIPSGSTLVLDASVQTSMTLSGVTVTDGGTLDTWNTVATQGTSALRPFYDSLALGTGPTVGFGGLGAPLNNTVQYLAIGTLAYQIPFTIVLLFRSDGPCNLLELSADATANPGVLLKSGSGWFARVRGPGGAEQRIDAGPGEFFCTDNSIHWIALSHDGTTPTLFLDGQAVPVSVNQPAGAPGTGAISQPATIGAGHGGLLNLTGAIGFFGLWPRVFSASDLSNMGQYIAAQGWITTPNLVQLYDCQTAGDSISGGATCMAISPNLYAYGPLLRQVYGYKFGQPLILENSGQTIATIQANWDSVGKPNLVSNGIKKVLLNEGGANDLIQFPGGINNGTQAATCAANMTAAMHTWVTDEVNALNALSGGPHVILLHTVSFIGGNTTFFNTARTTYNGNIQAQAPSWGTANVVVQPVLIGSDLILGSATGFPPPDGANTNYFTATGAIHPNKPGHQRWVGITAKAALALGL